MLPSTLGTTGKTSIAAVIETVLNASPENTSSKISVSERKFVNKLTATAQLADYGDTDTARPVESTT